jgi:hypothetical protein
MSRPDKPQPFGVWPLLLFLGLLKLLVQLLAIHAYGYFRDELYYIACSDHLAWGYVDQPPLSIALLWLNRHLWGDSLGALRMPPALAGAAVVILTGLLAHELSGGRFAQALAAASVIVAPVYLAIHHYYSMNAFDILFWTVAAYLVVLIIKTEQPWLWPALGLVIGLGLENKLSVLWLAAGLVAGLVLTPERRFLRTRGPWVAAMLALVLFLPHLLWQIRTGWPTLEFIRNATAEKMVALSPLRFLAEQWLMMQPLTLPIWLTGLLALLFLPALKPFRSLGFLYLTVLFILLLNGKSRPEYLSPAYPILLAAGAVVIERELRRVNRPWIGPAGLAILLLGGGLTAPFALPILPVERFIAYQNRLGVRPANSEVSELGELPQFYADMFGWPQMAATVAAVYRSLPREQQSGCVVITDNYGEAAAIDFFGKAYGLPPAISSHNNYGLWGPGHWSGQVAIVLARSSTRLATGFRQVTRVGTIRSRYAMPFETELPVFVCRGLRGNPAVLWPQIRHYE